LRQQVSRVMEGRMLALAFSAAIAGIDAHVVRVETDSAAGIPHFAIVGLPDRALNESRERIRAALVNSGFGFPPGRLLANLAPADMRKAGVGFDLAIALALLATDEQLASGALADFVACGELALDGSLRAVPGVLAMTLAAKRAGFGRILVPEANLAEAALVDGIDVYAVPTLCDAVAVALGHGAKFRRRGTTVLDAGDRATCGDFADVKGQTVAKRALEIAAAGGHNVVLVGPPGCGKTMLARRLPSILPAMTTAEALDVTKVYSVAGLLGARPRVISTRPFRAPHHTASRASLVGGGTQPRPGEKLATANDALRHDLLQRRTRFARVRKRSFSAFLPQLRNVRDAITWRRSGMGRRRREQRETIAADLSHADLLADLTLDVHVVGRTVGATAHAPPSEGFHHRERDEVLRRQRSGTLVRRQRRQMDERGIRRDRIASDELRESGRGDGAVQLRPVRAVLGFQMPPQPRVEVARDADVPAVFVAPQNVQRPRDLAALPLRPRAGRGAGEDRVEERDEVRAADRVSAPVDGIRRRAEQQRQRLVERLGEDRLHRHAAPADGLERVEHGRPDRPQRGVRVLQDRIRQDEPQPRRDRADLRLLLGVRVPALARDRGVVHVRQA
jgi:energy-coupling factor transporter ATP-binding protein EcfA2